MQNCYHVYGLIVKSDCLLPLPVSNNSSFDVTIDFDNSLSLPHDLSGEKVWFRVNRQEAWFYCKGTGLFLISHGKQIRVRKDPDASTDWVALNIIGTAMGILLFQRGLLVLHASAVQVGNSVIAFSGSSGAGKSTTAAAFVKAGCRLLTDDVAAIDISGEKPLLIPSFPMVKISKSVAEKLHVLDSFCDDPCELPNEKMCCLVGDEKFVDQPQPLECLYFLGCGEGLSLDAISSREALIELVANSFRPVPQRQFVEDEGHHFFQTAELVRKIKTSRLVRPDKLNKMEDVYNFVCSSLPWQAPQ